MLVHILLFVGSSHFPRHATAIVFARFATCSGGCPARRNCFCAELNNCLLLFTASVSGTKHRQYKSRTSDIHARLYLQTVAGKLADIYDIPCLNSKAGITFGDVLAARRLGNAPPKPNVAAPRSLSNLFADTEWQLLADLNDYANGRVHTVLGLRGGKPFMVCPQEFYPHAEEFKKIACLANITMEVDDLVVEEEFRTSSGSETGTPPRG